LLFRLQSLKTRSRTHLLENVAMNTRTNDWEAVWAEYDARAGAPTWQSHTPWYMDPAYVEAQEPTPEEGGGGGRPFMVLASLAVVLLAFMLNIRFVPEHPVHAAAPWQPVVAPVAMVSFGTPAEAAPTPPPIATMSDFGDLLALPPPEWVRAEAAPVSPAQVQAALDAVLLGGAAPPREALANREARPRQAFARQAQAQATQAQARQPQSRQAALRRHPVHQPRFAQARPAQPRRDLVPQQRAQPPSAQLAALPDQLCAPASTQRQQANAVQQRRQDHAQPAAGTGRTATMATPHHQGGKAQANVGAASHQHPGKLAMASAPRAPPSAGTRS
jgi:hypothetical protein